jgi:hypothetical protein
MTQKQYDAFSSAAEARGEQFVPGATLLWKLAMKYFLSGQDYGDHDEPPNNSRQIASSMSHNKLKTADLVQFGYGGTRQRYSSSHPNRRQSATGSSEHSKSNLYIISLRRHRLRLYELAMTEAKI